MAHTTINHEQNHLIPHKPDYCLSLSLTRHKAATAAAARTSEGITQNIVDYKCWLKTWKMVYTCFLLLCP